MNVRSWQGPSRKTVCPCLRVHSSTTFDWISQRETSILSGSPLLRRLRGCIIDPEQLHFLSLSKLIRCSAFTQPGLIPPSSSLLWNPLFSSHLSLSFFILRQALTPSLSCRCVFFSSLCVFSHQCSCLILICTHFCLFSSSDSFYPPSLSSPVFAAVSEHNLCQSPAPLSPSLPLLLTKIRPRVILSSWRDQLPLIAFGGRVTFDRVATQKENAMEKLWLCS